MHFLENIDGENYMPKFWQLQRNITRVLKALEDERLQLREGVTDEHQKNEDKLVREKIIKFRDNLVEYFGEQDDSAPKSYSEEEACEYRRRRIFSLAGTSFSSILELGFKKSQGEEVLKKVLHMTEQNIKTGHVHSHDFQVNLCSSFALRLVSHSFKLNYNTIVNYSRKLYTIRNQEESDRHISLEPYLFYVVLNWPGINTKVEQLTPNRLEEVLRQWREAFDRKYPNHDDGKSHRRKDVTTMFFLANGDDLQSIISHNELHSDTRQTSHVPNSIFWSQPYVVRTLTRFEGLLVDDGCKVKIKLGNNSEINTDITICTSIPIRDRSCWNKTVFFVIGFTWSGPKAYDVNPFDPTHSICADTPTRPKHKDHEGVQSRSDKKQTETETHTVFMGIIAELEGNLKAIADIEKKISRSEKVSRAQVCIIIYIIYHITVKKYTHHFHHMIRYRTYIVLAS